MGHKWVYFYVKIVGFNFVSHPAGGKDSMRGEARDPPLKNRGSRPP